MKTVVPRGETPSPSESVRPGIARSPGEAPPPGEGPPSGGSPPPANRGLIAKTAKITIGVDPACECSNPDGDIGCLMRSCPMIYCDIYIQPEASFEIFSRLGDMCCVQFVDMNPDIQAFQKSYISEVCRCDEMERKLRFMESEMVKDNIYMPSPAITPKPIPPKEMIQFENFLEKWEADIVEMAEYQTNLMKDLLEMKEIFYMLTNIGPLLPECKSEAGDIDQAGSLIILTGVVRRNLVRPFEIILWRISHGNIIFRLAAKDELLEDPFTGAQIRKVAFLAVCRGERLGTRMSKAAEGFRANVYPCPHTVKERNEMMNKIEERISDLERILKETKVHRCKALRTLGRHWRGWMIQVRKTKAIYHNMNLFNLDITKNCLIGQCWVPDQYMGKVDDTLAFFSQLKETTVASFMSKTNAGPLEPPTFYRTNNFTYGFQVLIDAYGDSKYGEINPGLFTIISFPFLFAMMFGDVGHALILVSFGLWMVYKEQEYMAQPSDNEIWNIFFHGRYVILLLGLFSIFSGFIYNDVFSKCLVITTPMWMTPALARSVDRRYLQNPTLQIDPAGYIGKPYLFGMDPTWPMAKNKIVFENSIKMKLSIIIGVIHMLFGIILSFFNHWRFKNYMKIFLCFIPEMLFLVCIFLYLVFMIYFKWLYYSSQNDNLKYGSACAPPLLMLFINMILMKETEVEDPNCDPYMYKSQKLVQIVLVAIAGLCIPVLLFGMPLATMSRGQNKQENDSGQHETKKINKKISEKNLGPDQQVKFSDLMINQGVHTIEFVLSTISHTASYLRLWALSLAHAQLSEMLWIMVLSKLALRDHTVMGIPKLFVVFAVWAAFTLSILVVMEGLSAFLHTLRLHWVEFMSKFFIGGGYPFRPFCFKTILSMDVKPEGACSPTKRPQKMKARESVNPV